MFSSFVLFNTQKTFFFVNHVSLKISEMQKDIFLCLINYWRGLKNHLELATVFKGTSKTIQND